MADVIKWPDPLEVVGGNSWSQDFELGHYTDPEDPDSWAPDDLSAWTDWTCQWRPSSLSSTVIVLTVESSAANEGKITISATPEKTLAMNGSGVFDFRAELSGDVRTFVRVRTLWRRGVTR